MAVEIHGTTGIAANWTTEGRPSSPTAGQQGYNTTLKQMEVYLGTDWISMAGKLTATGGDTITTAGDYTVHTFTSSGTFTPNKNGSVEYLVVAGGGGLGRATYYGGGGGAGGFRTATGFACSASSALTVTIGAGGVASGTVSGTSGGNSVFSTITSVGGGGGGTTDVIGLFGGSGGGGGGNDTAKAGGGSVDGQGNDGGASQTSGASAAGGAGGASSEARASRCGAPTPCRRGPRWRLPGTCGCARRRARSASPPPAARRC